MADRMDFQQGQQHPPGGNDPVVNTPMGEDENVALIDHEMSGDIHGPGKAVPHGSPGVKIRGNIKSGKGLSKRGKKAIFLGGTGIVGAVVLGVAMTAQHPATSSSSVPAQIAGASQAPTMPALPIHQTAVTDHSHVPTVQPNSSKTAAVTAALERAKHIAANGVEQQRLTPHEKYVRWLVQQHYHDLEGRYLAAESALVATDNWKHASSNGSGSLGGLLDVARNGADGLPAGIGTSPAMVREQHYLHELQKLEHGDTSNSSADNARANQGFLNHQRHKNSGYLDAQVHKARAKTEVFAGSAIPAVLITGINSQLPGMITAQVRANVYNSLNPNQILIPQGAKLIGVYDSDVQYGQDRVLVAWNRIIYPNGETLALHGMPGADGLGEAGFSQITDNHYWRIFGSAFLISLIGAGAQLSQPQQSSAFQNINAGQTATAAIAQEMDSVSTDMLQKNLNIAPTLKIRPGYLFNVMVSKTMVLPPYQPN